ncbi:MAG: hypothetical protein WD604_15400 [Balneolaceae bacterium]
MTVPQGYKWFVFRKVGEDKCNDIKISNGFRRRWMANNKMKKILDDLTEEESEKTELYVWKVPQKRA